MYEVIILACAFINGNSVELICEEQRLAELPACIVEVSNPRIYHPTINPTGDIFIKSIECKKMVPVAPPDVPGVKPA